MVLAVACGGPTTGEWPELPPNARTVAHDVIEQLHASAYSGITEPRRQAIKDGETWAAFWDEVQANVEPKGPPPEVDFNTHMALVAAMGARPSGGHAITIEGVYSAGDQLIVRVLEQAPGEGCFVTMALTAPVTAVVVPRFDGEVTFVEREERVDCG